LEIDGHIKLRDVVLRTLSAACKLAASEADVSPARSEVVSAKMVSAVGEAFNNIALHGYGSHGVNVVRLQIRTHTQRLEVVIEDFGKSFDPLSRESPDLDALPESGLGVFIMKSLMDEVRYQPGQPNVLTLTKNLT
jgi:serine/threonine-protein kinase RsbW